jgi:hypothetical protein
MICNKNLNGNYMGIELNDEAIIVQSPHVRRAESAITNMREQRKKSSIAFCTKKIFIASPAFVLR